MSPSARGSALFQVAGRKRLLGQDLREKSLTLANALHLNSDRLDGLLQPRQTGIALPGALGGCLERRHLFAMAQQHARHDGHRRKREDHWNDDDFRLDQEERLREEQ